MAVALRETSAQRILVLNAGPQAGETEGFTAVRHLETWAMLAHDIPLDAIIVDPRSVDDMEGFERTAGSLGARVVIADVLAGSGHHDPDRLTEAFKGLIQ